jgi:hypothetical protein
MENLNEQLSRIKNLIGYTHQANSNNLFEQEQDPTQDPLYAVVYSKLGDKSKRYWDGKDKTAPQMSNDDKIKIIQQVKVRVEKRVAALTSQGKKNVDFNRELKNIERIRISYKQSDVTKQPEEQGPVVYIPYKAQYPPAETNNPELQQFYYEENQVQVPQDRIEKFDVMVQELKNMIPANEKVVEIRIKAGSSTSQVPTKYGGGQYKTIVEGQQNNIQLAEDRCAAIEGTLKTIIEKYFPTNLGYKFTIDERQAKPNNAGPENKDVYTEKERKYFFGTGKLDPNKKAEYDAKYGPYKGSYGSVIIITAGTIEETSSVQDVIQTNEWFVAVDFPYKGGSNKPPKKYGSKGGGIIFSGGDLKTLACPAW